MSGVDRKEALAAVERFLKDLLPQKDCGNSPQCCSDDTTFDEDLFGIHPFFIKKGQVPLCFYVVRGLRITVVFYGAWTCSPVHRSI